jgi:hypothetical protein
MRGKEDVDFFTYMDFSGIILKICDLKPFPDFLFIFSPFSLELHELILKLNFWVTKIERF